MKEILACRKIFPCQIQTDSNFPLLATALISQLNMLFFAYSPFFFSDFHGNGVLGFWLWVIGLEPRIWIWWENHRLHQGLQACFWSGSVFFFFFINILFTYRNFHRFSSPITGFFWVCVAACIDHRGTPELPARTCTLEEYEGAICVS